jgi:hypothetical protein
MFQHQTKEQSSNQFTIEDVAEPEVFLVRGQKGKSEKGKSKKAIAFLDLPFFFTYIFFYCCCLFGFAIY